MQYLYDTREGLYSFGLFPFSTLGPVKMDGILSTLVTSIAEL
jgi:hypothetical protein